MDTWSLRRWFWTGACIGLGCLLLMLAAFWAAGLQGIPPRASTALRTIGILVLFTPVVLMGMKIAKGSKAELAKHRFCTRCYEDLTELADSPECPNCGLPMAQARPPDPPAPDAQTAEGAAQPPVRPG